ncbi:MAG: hypothetical protein Q4C47_08790 [Planctomycetia bacterium]|nr:hypothetical protein [Planctomycetia bacterium]
MAPDRGESERTLHGESVVRTVTWTDPERTEVFSGELREVLRGTPTSPGAVRKGNVAETEIMRRRRKTGKTGTPRLS